MFCKTCKHWQITNLCEWHELVLPYRPDDDYNQCENEEEATRVFGHAVRQCTSPKILFYQRPDIDGAAVVDGSNYRASFLTSENFGCIHYEST